MQPRLTTPVCIPITHVRPQFPFQKRRRSSVAMHGLGCVQCGAPFLMNYSLGAVLRVLDIRETTTQFTLLHSAV